jgi:hypothetical protein
MVALGDPLRGSNTSDIQRKVLNSFAVTEYVCTLTLLLTILLVYIYFSIRSSHNIIRKNYHDTNFKTE